MSEAPQPSGYLVNPPLTTREREVLKIAQAGIEQGQKIRSIEDSNRVRFQALNEIIGKLEGRR